MTMTSDKSCHNKEQVSSSSMSGDNTSSMYMAYDRVIVKHNQAELSRLEVRSANSV